MLYLSVKFCLFKLKFLQNEKCVTACEKKYLKSDSNHIKKLRFLKKGILLNYQQHWIVDNLPIVWCYYTEENKKFCARGFPVGCYVNKFGVQKDVCKLFVNPLSIFLSYFKILDLINFEIL